MTRARWILIGCVAALLVALGVGAAGGRGILYQAIYNSGRTGAADMTQQAFNKQWVTVSEFGAKGDGVTDDTASIQAAIDSVGASGGTVYFPPATYYVASKLNISATEDRVRLLGSRGNSNLTTLSGTYAHLDIQGNSGDFAQHVTVEGLRFIGSGLGIQTRYTETLLVRDCMFSGTANGLYMSMNGGESDIKPTIINNRADNVGRFIQSGDTRVADGNFAFNYVVDATVRAFDFGYLDGGAIVYNKIFNDLSSATENDGIQILRPIYLKVEGNDVFSVNGYGIRISSPRRSHIVGNTVITTGQTNKKSAMQFLLYSAVTSELNEIRDNKIYQAYGSGLDITSMSNSDVTGNKIVGAGQGGAVYDAITCTSCVGVRLLDNFIDGQSVTRYWLSLTTSTSINLGMGNTYTATVQADLFRSGTNTMSIGRNPTATSQTAAYAATYLDSVINADATGGTFAITLPSAAAAPGKVYEIVKTDSTTNAVTIATTGGQTVNGLATASGLTTQYAKATLTSDGTNWQAVFAGTETLLFSRHIAGLIAASTTYTRTQLPTNGTFVLDAVTSNINGGPAAAGAGTIVFRITDGTNNCDCTANCITTSPHFGSLSSAPRVPCTGTCSFAGGSSLAFTTTTANCATTLPTVVSIDARGHWK